MVKKLVCKICGQKFAMPGHLGRHMSATHGKGKAGAAKKTGKKSKRGPVRAAIEVVTDLGAGDALASLQGCYDRLVMQQSRIDEQMVAVRNAMTALGATNGAAPRPAAGRKAGRRRVGRPAGKASKAKRGGKTRGMRAGSLKEYILRALQSAGKAMGIPEIEKAVLSAGYPTKSSKLINAINNTMGKVPGVRKVSRGVYAAK